MTSAMDSTTTATGPPIRTAPASRAHGAPSPSPRAGTADGSRRSRSGTTGPSTWPTTTSPIGGCAMRSTVREATGRWAPSIASPTPPIRRSGPTPTAGCMRSTTTPPSPRSATGMARSAARGRHLRRSIRRPMTWGWTRRSRSTVTTACTWSTTTRPQPICGTKANGQPWSSPIVVLATGSVGTGASIAVDQNGGVHVAFHEAAPAFDLRYAYKPQGAAFTVSTLDTTGDVGQQTSIAVHNNVHISYYDATNEDLKYITKPISGIPSAPVVVDSSGSVGRFNSLEADPMGGVHIAYYDLTNTGARYAYRPAGSFVTQAVATSGSMGEFTSLALGPDGGVYVSYYDGLDGNLRLGYKAAGGTTFLAVQVDSGFGNAVGTHSSMVVDSAGVVSIAIAAATTTRRASGSPSAGLATSGTSRTSSPGAASTPASRSTARAAYTSHTTAKEPQPARRPSSTTPTAMRPGPGRRSRSRPPVSRAPTPRSAWTDPTARTSPTIGPILPSCGGRTSTPAAPGSTRPWTTAARSASTRPSGSTPPTACTSLTWTSSTATSSTRTSPLPPTTSPCRPRRTRPTTTSGRPPGSRWIPAATRS